jgi:hypothetical protein
MKCNEGKTDRSIRIVLGLVIMAAGVYFKSWCGAVGLMPLLTGIIGFCPGYLLFKISTVEKKEKTEHKKN